MKNKYNTDLRMDVESTFVCECACSHACTWRRWGTSTDTGVWNQSEGQVRNPPPPPRLQRTALRLLDCLYYCAEKWQQIYGIRVWKANEINRVAELIWNAVFRVTKRGAVCKSVCQYQSARENNKKVSKQEYLGYITISSLKWEAVKISMWPDLIAVIQLPVQGPASHRLFRSGMLHRFTAVSL